MQEDNKRIARNTLIVYVRLGVTTILGLVSSRFVLKALGASDYGLYNVVGAIVIMFSFISSALYSTTTRFINYEQGKENGNVNRIFNISLVIHILFAVICLLILESIGVIYINNFLNVVSGKEGDAMFVFQMSTIAACVGIINVPFQSLFIAGEKFSIIAVVDICYTILRFLLIIILLYYPGNPLRFYAVCMAFVILLNATIYYIISKKKWPEIISINIVKGRSAYKEMFFFNNYNVLSAMSIIVRNQGSNMLINYFFGTVVNAAYAIAYTIQTYITTFVGSFDAASAPQITQNFSKGNKERSFLLTTTTCRICVLLTIFILFPVYSELDYILYLWLGDNVPEETSEFCKFSLLVALMSSTSAGLFHLINSVGKLKWFTWQFTLLYILALIFGFALYRIGYSPCSIIVLYIIADLISRFNQLMLLRKYINLDIRDFVKRTYTRPVVVFILGLIYIQIGLFESHLLNLFFSLVIVSLLIFVIGLEKNEKQLIISYMSKKRLKC